MAGIAKPSYDVKNEAGYKIISGGNGIGSHLGLFDGTTPEEWDTNNVFYWNSNSSYLEIEFYSKVILHRFYSWPNNNNQRLKILKHDGIDYNIDLTHLHLDISKQTSLTWSPFTYALPRGKYKFMLDSTNSGFYGRIDGEWYVESFSGNSLIKSNNKYYTYQNNEFIEVEPTIENFENNYTDLSQLITPTTKAVLTMDGGGLLGGGKEFRKSINMMEFKNKYGLIEKIGLILFRKKVT